jgi:hypothetical protein
MPDRKQVLIYLDDETNAAMRAAAAEAGQTLTEYIRRAIRARLDEQPWINDIETRDNEALRANLQRWHNRGARA